MVMLMLYPQFAGKVSPNNNPNAKGVFFNVGLDSKKQHFIRAIFEGIAYMLNENVKAIENCGVEIKEVRSLGGGAKSDVWNQIKADIINKPIVTLECDEATSLGVAIVAAVSLGWVEDIQTACSKAVRVKKTFYPNKKNVEQYIKGYKSYKKLESQLEKLFISN